MRRRMVGGHELGGSRVRSLLRGLHPRRQDQGPRRILHIVSSLQVGGMEQFVLRLASRQQARGACSRVLALRDGPLSETARALGLTFRSLGGLSKPRRIVGAVAVALGWAPRIVHVHNTSSLHYGTLCASLLRCPLVMTFHGQGKGFSRHPRAFEWQALDAVAAVSRAAARDLEERVPPGRMEVIHNGIDLRATRGLRESVRRALELSDVPVLIVVARMDRLKGHRELIDAMGQLRDRGVPATALLVGDGADRPSLEAQAQQLGLDQQWVRFLGFRTDVADLLEAADVFVLPSLSEGLPLSLLEAMAHGVAVVATRVGGIPEVVTDDREAILVPPRDPLALAEALERALGDLELRRRLAAAAVERVRAGFSFDTMLDQYDALYARIEASRR